MGRLRSTLSWTRLILSLLSISLLVLLRVAGCDKKGDTPKPSSAEPTVTLTVFAAASLTEALGEITALYKAVAPAVTLSFNFDSSGKLQTQIENGAEADIFFSAGQKQMDALAGDNYIDTGTRRDLLVNKLVLIVPRGSTAGIASFEDCLTGKVKLISLGGPGVPVGQYAEEAFRSLNGWDAVSAKASFGSNVKEVLSQVESGSVSCGVVYATDAAASKGVTVAARAPEGSHSPAAYPAAVLKGSANAEAAGAFLRYLMSSPEAAAAFEGAGFELVKRD